MYTQSMLEMKTETVMTSQDAAKILFNCATLLEMDGANRYRIAAYRRAALILLRLGDLAPRLVANDEALKALGVWRPPEP